MSFRRKMGQDSPETATVSQYDDQPVTQILDAAKNGEADAVHRLLAVVYEELRGLASARLKGMGPGQSLRPTDLVHEAYIKLVGSADRSWENRCHFVNAAGTAMRSVLVDRARAKASVKRGGDRNRGPLHADFASVDSDPLRVLAIDEALTAFAAVDERACRVVTLRIFLGLPEPEIATILGVTDRTVQRDWKFAKAWLTQALSDEYKRPETSHDT